MPGSSHSFFKLCQAAGPPPSQPHQTQPPPHPSCCYPKHFNRYLYTCQESDQTFAVGREIPVAAGKTKDLKAAEVAFDDMTTNGSQGTEIQLLEGFRQHGFGRGKAAAICVPLLLDTTEKTARYVFLCLSALPLDTIDGSGSPQRPFPQCLQGHRLSTVHRAAAGLGLSEQRWIAAKITSFLQAVPGQAVLETPRRQLTWGEQIEQDVNR